LHPTSTNAATRTTNRRIPQHATPKPIALKHSN
jgi:hypothetical protein